MTAAVACVAALIAGTPALGQIARVVTTVSGQDSITVPPGQAVRVGVEVEWDGSLFCHVSGGTIVEGNAGVANNFVGSVPPGPTISLGAFVGGSRPGAEITYPPPGFPPSPNQSRHPFKVWEYDLRLDEPGTYDVTWQAGSVFAQVLVFPSFTSFQWTALPTTFTTATITVVPGAPTAAMVGACVLLIGGRPRRAVG